MADYICGKCGKNLGDIARSGGFEGMLREVAIFHEQVHFRKEKEMWTELLSAAREFVEKSRGAANVSALPRLVDAVEALREEK